MKSIPGEQPSMNHPAEVTVHPTSGRSLDEEQGSGLRVYGWLLAVFALIAIGLAIAKGCGPIREMAWDFPIPMDAAWRMIQGQIPHRDFYAPIDVVPLLIYAAGMKISPDAKALAYGTSILAAILFPTAWYVARKRFSGLHAFVFSAMIGLLVIAPRSLGLGRPATHTTYAMNYNRIGWAFTCLASALLLPRRGEARSHYARSDAFLMGALCGVLFFVKVNYLVAGVLLAVAFAASRRRNFRSLLIFAFGAGMTSIALLSILRFDLAAMARDLRLVAASAGEGGMAAAMFQRLYRLAEIGWYSAGALTLLAAWGLIAWRASRRESQDRRALILPVLLVPFAFLVCSANAQNYEMPLLPLAALIGYEGLRRTSHATPNATSRAMVSLYAGSVLAIYLTCSLAVPDLISLVYSYGWHETAEKHVQPADLIRSVSMASMFLPREREVRLESNENILRYYRNRTPEEEPTSYEYLLYLNSGLELLRPHVTSATRVVALDSANPFSFALGLPSAHGGAMFWHYGRGFTASVHPDAGQTLREADLVIVPKSPLSFENERHILDLFSPLLERDFRVLDENPMFLLYARRGGNGASPKF